MLHKPQLTVATTAAAAAPFPFCFVFFRLRERERERNAYMHRNGERIEPSGRPFRVPALLLRLNYPSITLENMLLLHLLDLFD